MDISSSKFPKDLPFSTRQEALLYRAEWLRSSRLVEKTSGREMEKIKGSWDELTEETDSGYL